MYLQHAGKGALLINFEDLHMKLVGNIAVFVGKDKM